MATIPLSSPFPLSALSTDNKVYDLQLFGNACHGAKRQAQRRMEFANLQCRKELGVGVNTGCHCFWSLLEFRIVEIKRIYIRMEMDGKKKGVKYD
ncbi:hypothetical protein CEXT_78031 [Caerostris extrusa]|uniref:Uncharacterized protein n=1 Tax=Caerostris extrusa TaxID=172846 RepID=A0AAV4QFE4_CAEEX|nr:hypothetical protein CEXT_78031 [Caerostris extrusa]